MGVPRKATKANQPEIGDFGGDEASNRN